MKRFALGLMVCLFIQPTHAAESGICKGRFINVMKEVCWDCIFPISIGPSKISKSKRPDTKNPSSPICYCQKGPIPQIGFSVGFWEPIALVDVTRIPYCLVGLGGIRVTKSIKHMGGHWSYSHRQNAGSKVASYQVHWVKFPLFAVLNLFMDFMCLEQGDIDVGYMSELDPLWNDEELAALIHPEVALFANPIAQMACAYDCASASTGLPSDTLFWCGGCQGSLYPFTGTNAAHGGGVQSSLLLTSRMIAKLHRQLMLPNTSATSGRGLCMKTLAPTIKKSQYRVHMSYPRFSRACNPLGRTEVLWGSGKEYPYKGEDFGYVVWRKRNCCVRAM